MWTPKRVFLYILL